MEDNEIGYSYTINTNQYRHILTIPSYNSKSFTYIGIHFRFFQIPFYEKQEMSFGYLGVAVIS